MFTFEKVAQLRPQKTGFSHCCVENLHYFQAKSSTAPRPLLKEKQAPQRSLQAISQDVKSVPSWLVPGDLWSWPEA